MSPRSGPFVLVPMVLLVVMISPCQAQQDPPRGDCCYQIFSAGSNLGWASSLLKYTTVRTRLEQADETIFDDMNRAGKHIEAAYACCSALNPAWADWQGKKQFLQSQVNAIRQRPAPIIRSQVALGIAGTYSWAADLRVRVFNGRRYGHDTCAEKYFKLGFKIAEAQQTLGIALEIRQSGGNQWPNIMNDANQSLLAALQVISEYGQVGGCTDLRGLDLGVRLDAVMRANPQDMNATYDSLQKIWENLQALLMVKCESAAGIDMGTPNDTTQAVGRWVVHHGGIIGTPAEYQEDHRGRLFIQSTGGGLQGSLEFEGLPGEVLSGVSFSEGVLRFTRPVGQRWQGPVRDNRVVGGTFDFGTVRYRWWAERKDTEQPLPASRQPVGQADCVAKYCPVCGNSITLLNTSTQDCENCKSRNAAQIAQCNAQNSAPRSGQYDTGGVHGLTTENWAGAWVCQIQGTAPMYMTITGQGRASGINSVYPEQAGSKQATATATSITSLTGTHAEGEEEMHRGAQVWRGSWAITVNGSALSLERQDYNTRWHGSYGCRRQE